MSNPKTYTHTLMDAQTTDGIATLYPMQARATAYLEIVIVGAGKVKFQGRQKGMPFHDIDDPDNPGNPLGFTTPAPATAPHTLRFGVGHGYYQIVPVAYDMAGGSITVTASESDRVPRS